MPTPALNGFFQGAAGAASSDVWAVGQQAQGSSFLPLIEHWDGTSWSVVPSPKLSKDSELRAVTAPATNSVWAAGLAGGSSNALVEHWDGVSWSLASSPAFTGVSVTGISSDSPVIEHWDGTNWSVVPSPNPNPQGNNGLGVVAAASANDVWAFGFQLQGPFAEQWNGTSWSLVALPSGVSRISGATALSDGTIVAVGRGTNNSGVILHN